jgi:D-sedoheptulose 7-phosphate isomerase
MVEEFLKEHINVAEKTKKHIDKIKDIAEALTKTLMNNKKILICGNGGSAADAQHFAAELIGRYKKERKSINAIALTTDTSILTAIGNDYGFDKVFARQVEGLGKEGDVLFVISTSGNSENLLNAAKVAKEKRLYVIGLLGKGGGKLKELCDKEITIESENTPRIQEMHIMIIHILCEIIEEKLMQNNFI